MTRFVIKSSASWVRAAVAILIAAPLGGPGCGPGPGADPEPTVPVGGRVTYKGKPLTQGEIFFYPVSGTMFAHGTIRADGRFELTTYSPGDGAAVGIHRVSLGHLGERTRVPGEYTNPLAPKIEVEVVEGRDEYLVDLE